MFCIVVYCANFLLTHSEKLRGNSCRPYYFVNIADTNILSKELSYIACKSAEYSSQTWMNISFYFITMLFQLNISVAADKP